MPLALSTVLIWAALALYAAIVIVAGLIAPESYSIRANTVSELGSQGFPNAWAMRVGFVLLGLAAVGIAVIAGLRAEGIARLLVFATIGAYGVAVLLTGVFSAAPLGSESSNLEATIHSLCAQVAGVAFLAGVVVVAARPGSPLWFGWLSGAAFLLVLVLSLLFFVSPGLQGIWQRGLQGVSLVWLAAASR